MVMSENDKRSQQARREKIKESNGGKLYTSKQAEYTRKYMASLRVRQKEEDEKNGVIRRGRGRPKKEVKPDEEVKVKLPRGRPKKVKP